MAQKRLGLLGQCCALACGATIGTIAFLVLTALFLGKPFRDTVVSAHGILVANKATPLSTEQSALVLDMLQKGALISSSDLLSNMTAFYSTVIQTLIGTFFVFGVLSFFVVQAHSRRHVEESAESLVEAATNHHFASRAFDHHLRETIGGTVRIELDVLDERVGVLEQLEDNVKRLEAIVSANTIKTDEEE